MHHLTYMNCFRTYAVVVTLLLLSEWHDYSPKMLDTKALVRQITEADKNKDRYGEFHAETMADLKPAAMCQLSTSEEWTSMAANLLKVNAATPWARLPQIAAVTPALQEGNMWNQHSTATCGHYSCVDSFVTEWTQAKTEPLGPSSNKCQISNELKSAATKAMAEHEKNPNSNMTGRNDYCRKYILSFSGMGSQWLAEVAEKAHLQAIDPIYSLPNASPESFLEVVKAMHDVKPQGGSCKGDKFRAVVVVRDPRDALLDSHNSNLLGQEPWLYTPLMTHGGVSFKQLLERCGFAEGLVWEMERVSHPWANVCKFISWAHPDVKIVQYESLLSNPREAWERVAVHLYPEVAGPADENRAHSSAAPGIKSFVSHAMSSKLHSHPKGPPPAKGKPAQGPNGEAKGAWATKFTEAHRHRFYDLYHELLEVMGYESNFGWKHLWDPNVKGWQHDPESRGKDVVSLRVEDMPLQTRPDNEEPSWARAHPGH